MSPEELERVTPTLVRGRMGALVWKKAARSQTIYDSRAGRVLHRAFVRQSITARLDELRIAKVLKLLAARNLVPILIKGWDSARFYPPGLRPLGDIDLIFRENDLEAAMVALAKSPREGRSVDLGPHKFAWENSQDLEELFDGSRETAIGETAVLVLSNEDRLRILCAHMFQHRLCMPLWLCDIAAVIESLPAEFDWERCLSERPLRKRQIKGAIALAHDLLGASVDRVPPHLVSEPLSRLILQEIVAEWTRWIRAQTLQPVPAPIPMKPFLAALLARWPVTSRATIFLETGTIPGRANLGIRHMGSFIAHAVSYGRRSARRAMRIRKEGFSRLKPFR